VGAQLLAFLGVSLVVICVPGPDTALTVRNALAGGRRCGVATAAGVATGQAVWTLATGIGIAELLQASEPAFLAMKFAGAAYLILLGLQSLWSATVRRPTTLWTAARPRVSGRLRSPTGGPDRGGRGSCAAGDPTVPQRGDQPAPGDPKAPQRRGSRAPGGGTGVRRGAWQGLVSNLANPKMAAFFLSLLPQFAGPGTRVVGVLGLGLVFCLMTFGWLALYSVVVDRARRVLARARVRRVLDGVSGLVLVGFGARLAVQQR
jgi:threonine/homoserine/homoserine lactone efflux protein